MIAGPRRLDETPVTRGGAQHHVLASWEREFGVTAGVAGTMSGEDYSLASVRPGDPAPRAWESLQDALGFSRLAAARQVHGSCVRIHGDELTEGLTVLDRVDGHVTRRRDVLLAVTVADCVPVFLAEPSSGVVALIHAGWRGIAGGIVEAGIASLLQVSGAREESVVMHCGISICGDCYDVGPEVRSAVGSGCADGSAGLDLRRALCDRAARLGVVRMTTSGLCTAHSEAGFHSHRGSAGRAGRMLAYLGRRAA